MFILLKEKNKTKQNKTVVGELKWPAKGMAIEECWRSDLGVHHTVS